MRVYISLRPTTQELLVVPSLFSRTRHPPYRTSRQYVTRTSIRRKRRDDPQRDSPQQPPPPLPPPIKISDDLIASLSSKPLYPLTLADLVKHGRPPLSAEALFSSANFILSLLPARLAHRIRALRNLPFIVVSNPNISQIHANYVHSLSTLLPYQERQISNLEDEIHFTEVMADLVQTHSNTIPILARGFLECRKYISPADVTAFLDEHLRARIGTRLIAEQHIALHLSSHAHNPGQTQPPPPPTSSSSSIGVIDTALRPAEIIRHCESFVSEICELKYGVRPSVLIKGDPTTTLAHVPTHLEYVLTELLKNAFRATVENSAERHPIEVTIASATHELHGFPPPSSSSSSPSPADSTLQTNPPTSPPTRSVTIRIRDRGGGIPPNILPHIWAYSFTTFSDDYISDSHPPPSSTSTTTSSSLDDGLSTLSSASAGGVGVGVAATAGVGGGAPPTSTSPLLPNAMSSTLAGLGYGLPLGRAYAEYFGGGIALQSLWGWGTDVYLRLRGLGGV